MIIKPLECAFLIIKILIYIGFFSIVASADPSVEQSVVSNVDEISTQLQGIEQPTEENLSELESLTEAGAGCTTPECMEITTDQTIDEIRQLCLKSLPEYCEGIKEEFTSCYEDDESFVVASIKSAGACIVGGIGGVVDFFVVTWELGGVLSDLLKDSYYRDEALDVMSYIMEQIMDSEDGVEEVLKEFLLSPVLEEIDEFISCLNYKGRWEYVCEGGVQIFIGVKAVKVGKAVWKPIKNRRKFKLSFLDQLAGKRKIKKKLKAAKLGNKLLDIRELGPYEMTLLSKKDMRLIDVRFMTDKMGERMSKRQLHAISLGQIKDLSVRRAGRVFSRLSNKQFKAVIDSDPSKIRDMSMYVVERNLRRIDPSHIPSLSDIRQISPSGFGQMSVEQIRSLSARQLREVAPAQQAALRGARKQAFDEMYNNLH